MGLGGDLLWTPVLQELHKRNGCPVVLCDRPRLSDLLCGRRFDGASSRDASPVFRGHPDADFPSCGGKNVVQRALDRFGESLISWNRLKPMLEAWCYGKSRREGFRMLYLDLPQHSYVERFEEERCVWKKGGHIIDILSASVDLPPVKHQCSLAFSAQEEEEIKALKERISGANFVVIEPHTNQDYFGKLRSWSFDKWQLVVRETMRSYPDLTCVQLGIAGSQVLEGCVDLCGQTTFKQAAGLIRSARAFFGTEGGLMHVANAVGVPAVIVWSGLTNPEFAGYPDMHSIVHHPVDCSPCGRLGHCPNGHKCMESISVEDVKAAVDALLSQGISSGH